MVDQLPILYYRFTPTFSYRRRSTWPEELYDHRQVFFWGKPGCFIYYYWLYHWLCRKVRYKSSTYPQVHKLYIYKRNQMWNMLFKRRTLCTFIFSQFSPDFPQGLIVRKRKTWFWVCAVVSLAEWWSFKLFHCFYWRQTDCHSGE